MPYTPDSVSRFCAAAAVADLVDRHAELVEQRHVQVRERRFRGEAQVAAALQRARPAAEHQDRQIGRCVRVAVGHPVAIQQHHVIEQRAVAVGRRRELFHVVREQRRVVGVDLGEVRELDLIVVVVRGRVMRLVDADLREGAPADLPPQHQRDHARQVALIGEHLQVEHQLHVIGERRRDARRLVDHRQRRVLLLGPLNPPFDVADRFEVFARASPGPTRRRGARGCSPFRSPSRAGCGPSGCARAAPPGSVLPPSPNSRSNTTRGLCSIGSGVVGELQAMVFE